MYLSNCVGECLVFAAEDEGGGGIGSQALRLFLPLPAREEALERGQARVEGLQAPRPALRARRVIVQLVHHLEKETTQNTSELVCRCRNEEGRSKGGIKTGLQRGS